MTKKEFLNIKVGDKLVDYGYKISGTVVKCFSTGIDVIFKNMDNMIISYDLTKNSKCYNDLYLNN